jgi:hypothetical protein
VPPLLSAAMTPGRDCVVVGCGRSGTSLAAGLLAQAGYNVGDRLLEPDAGSPRGHFEDGEVNRLNEELLAPYAERAPRAGYSRPLRDGERWLAAFPPDVAVESRPELTKAMAAVVPASPFCLKDPRFCHTLAAWRGLLGDPLFVCVFRHPLATARSIARDVRYGDLVVDLDAALAVWASAYARVLARHAGDGDWLFVHYEQLLDGSGVRRLGERLGAALDPAFAQRSLSRASADGAVPDALAAMYEELCAAAA